MSNVQHLQSKLLSQAGVRHGWFMRYGGVSEGLFKSLNGKKGNGDLDSNVDENRKRALAALGRTERGGAKPNNGALGFIVHSFKTNIHEVLEPGEYKGFDGSITTKSDIVLAHATADCGSIIISSIDGKIVALVHGSWHTLKDKIICDIVAKMKQHTQRELVAGIGPMICTKCYEFGPEAITLFDKQYIKSLTCHPERSEAEPKDLSPPQNQDLDDKTEAEAYHVDLKQMILDQLHQSGITQIDDINVCTKEDERFFSHRRSGANSGRFLTLVAPTDVI